MIGNKKKRILNSWSVTRPSSKLIEGYSQYGGKGSLMVRS